MPRIPSTKSPILSRQRRSSLDEPRRHIRFPVALAVKCTERGPGKPRSWRGRTADVSGGGFAVELPAKLVPGLELHIEVRTGIGPMRLEAEVLWARKVAGVDRLFRHGIRLAEGSEILDLPVSVLLGEWLQKLASQEPRSRKAAAAPQRVVAPPRPPSARGASRQDSLRRGKSRTP